MKIKAITIENFKSISEPVRIEFKPLTLLFGPNSAGKSTIIQALHYIREVLEFRRLDVDKTISGGDFIDLGGFDNFVHGHDTSRKVSFKIELHGLEPFVVSNESDFKLSDMTDDFFTESNLWLSFSIKKEGSRVVVDNYALCYNDIVYVASRRNEEIINLLLDKKKSLRDIDEILDCFDLSNLDHESRTWWADVGQKFQLLNTSPKDDILPEYRGEETNIYDILESYAVGHAKRSIIDSIVDSLQNLLYVGPLRTIPPRNYSPQKTIAPSRWSDGLAAWDKASYSNQESIDEINNWLGKERLDTGYALKGKGVITLEQDELQLIKNPGSLSKEDLVALVTRLHAGKVALTQGKDGLEVSLCDVGVGISQTFPVVMATLDKDAKMVIIEQPELHIHPRLQVELGDLFISAANQGKCMIIETHSEHLMLRIMRRIRETIDNELPEGFLPFTAGQLAILYAQPSKCGLEVIEISVRDDGEFAMPWPKGFFAERIRELY